MADNNRMSLSERIGMIGKAMMKTFFALIILAIFLPILIGLLAG